MKTIELREFMALQKRHQSLLCEIDPREIK
jgi:hypothetical protein